MIVTKEFIKDLKTARAFVVRFNGNCSSIQIFHKDDKRNVTVEFKSIVTLPAALSSIFSEWYTTVYIDQNGPLTTFIKSLRAGDKLTLFPSDNSSGNCLEKGLYTYHLNGIVNRYKRNSDILASVNHWYIDSITKSI